MNALRYECRYNRLEKLVDYRPSLHRDVDMIEKSVAYFAPLPPHQACSLSQIVRFLMMIVQDMPRGGAGVSNRSQAPSAIAG